MSENKKLELLDQYDDVTFALLMDEYAEEEGARLRKEFEEAQAAGEVSDTSDSLDEKCLQMIHRDFAKKRGKDNVRKFIRMTSKVAVAVMVFFGIAATTIMSVDALRVPVLSYIVSHFDGFTLLTTEENIQESDSTYCTVLENLLPSDYYQKRCVDTENTFVTIYENEKGDVVQLLILPENSDLNIDSEDVMYSEIMIADYKAVLIEKDGYQVIWRDIESGKTFNFRATKLSLQQVIEICNSLTF